MNGIVEELDKKISLSLPKKRVHHRYMNFFGISVFKFQMQLSDTFKCSVIEASFHCDPDYQFLCFVPAPEYVARLTEFSHQLLDMYSEEPRMNNFAFNKTRRGLHISLIYENDGRSQFDMRRKKNLIEAYKQKYSKVAICLTNMMTFSPIGKDDTVAIKAEGDEIMTIRSSLDLMAVGFEPHLTILRRLVHKKLLKKQCY